MIYAIYETSTGRVVSWKSPPRHSLDALQDAMMPGMDVVEVDARVDGPCKVVDGAIVSLPVDADAITARQVRAERNHKLTASDWTQVADAPVDAAAWATYRQALRDVPDQVGFPNNVTWPQPPA